MFLKYLSISNNQGEIRHIPFRMGLNIITNAPTSNHSDTGNNVGKTTLLHLINFCLGGNSKDIYTSGTNKENKKVRDFLYSTQVKITLCIVEDYYLENTGQHIITRQFVNDTIVNTINGEKVTSDSFDTIVQEQLWNRTHNTPSFRQIISHSIRINSRRQEETLYTLDSNTTEEQNQAYLLYLFGANPDDSQSQDRLLRTIRNDKRFRNILLRDTSEKSILNEITQIEQQIKELETKTKQLKISSLFEEDLSTLAITKQQLAEEGTKLNDLMIRKRLIQESLQEIEDSSSNADAQAVESIYQQAKMFCPQLHHTFEELISFHTKMNLSRFEYIQSELSSLDRKIKQENKQIEKLRSQEQELVCRLNESIAFCHYTELVDRIGQFRQELGKLNCVAQQISDITENIRKNQELYNKLTNDIFSSTRQELVKRQVSSFNCHFNQLSQLLYGADFNIRVEIKQNKNGSQYYKFNCDYPDNHSTGKQQGEVTCFDLAYIPFADQEEIPCLHFILNDKRELLDDNQLVQAARWVEQQNNVQYVATILRSKLPKELDKDKYLTLTLSSSERLFRLE